MKKRILAAMLTLSMVVSMTACGNSDAGGSKDSAKNNGNGDEPYTVTMVLNGSTQPDEERIEQKINEILEPELNANLDIVVLPWASASQQLQLMLSGDEKIDVFYTQATNAVQYMNAGQIVEVGTVEEVFYDPRHPYTWALLSSLPQLAERNTTLYSITGTPPSLYNSIVGDAFAPRNPYCMKIDTLEEPPMFKVTDTHYAKTWLLHPDAPKVEKPEGIQNIHEKLVKAFNI
jgi:oligopeptide/dipeptide ABC transporter ATP-binding protein